jgi:hypothetical protein
MTRSKGNPRRRWLMIQVHRAQIARISRSRSGRPQGEIARRMNAIALLCDCGRTEAGQQLALMLAREGGPDLESLLSHRIDLAEPS